VFDRIVMMDILAWFPATHDGMVSQGEGAIVSYGAGQMPMLSQIPIALRNVVVRPMTQADRNIRRLMAFTALFGVINGGVITFLPVLLARLGAPAVVISLLTALPALITIVIALPAGAIVSRWRNMTRSSALCFYALRLAYLPIALALFLDPAVAPYLIVIIWALTAIPGTLGNTAFYDVLADAVPPQRRAIINGVRWALLGMVSAGSVSFFGQLLVRLSWPINYLVLFGICFVAGITSTFAYSRLEIPLRDPQDAPRERTTLRKRLATLVQPLRAGTGFGSYSVITFVMRLGLFLPAGIFSVFLVRQLQVSDAWIGGRTTLEHGALTLGYFFWGRMAARMGQARMLGIAVTAIGVAFLLLASATSNTLWLVLVAALIGGFFASALDVSLFEWLLQIMPQGERPRYVAMNTLLMNLVAFVVPIAGAALAERTSISLVLQVAGVCLFSCALLIYVLTRRQRRVAQPMSDVVQSQPLEPALETEQL
jgi:MFS family permease